MTGHSGMRQARWISGRWLPRVMRGKRGSWCRGTWYKCARGSVGGRCRHRGSALDRLSNVSPGWCRCNVSGGWLVVKMSIRYTIVVLHYNHLDVR